jgi:predicted transglutaminase-like cysteine proteinase
MGQATILANLGDGKYNIRLIKEPGKSVARIAKINKDIETASTNIATAEAAANTASAAMETARTALNVAIEAYKLDPKTDLTKPQSDLVNAMADYEKKKRKVSELGWGLSKLEAELSMLQAAMANEDKTNIWCMDKTVNLVVGAQVGTAEINSAPVVFQIVPEGKTTDAFGIVQPVGVSTPSAVFFNRAILPGMQKWYPTYRYGTIVSIDYDNNKCDVVLDPAYSYEGGFNINQEGTKSVILQQGVDGWTAFCGENPDNPMTTNTGDTQITMSDQLMADMLEVNAEVNNNYKYKFDSENYGIGDVWTPMSEGGTGDCEDFALTKAKLLIAKGYPASAIHIEIGVTAKGTGHAWLVIQTSTVEFALDLGQSTPVPNGSLPYTNRKRQYGSSFYGIGVLLSGVDFYYMQGTDSALFFPQNITPGNPPTVIYSGDRVVVEFQNMAWNQPLVIGFESNPRATEVNFYIGKTTAPFSEYTRSQVSARCLRYFGVGPNANLNDLNNGRIKLLILPCPRRVLADEELTAIQQFRSNGGRVALFAGESRDVTNQILVQLGSKLEIMPTRMTSSTKILSGYMVESGDSAPEMFWIPAEVRGWVNIRQEQWANAALKDFYGYGFEYNSIACSMMYETYLKKATSGYMYSALHHIDIRTDIEEFYAASPAPSPSPYIDWIQYANTYPAGHVTEYQTMYLNTPEGFTLATYSAWLLANASKLPHMKIEDYGYETPTLYTPYGYVWDLDDMKSVEMFGPLIAYAEGENLVVTGLKLTYLTDAVGNPVTLDYYFHTEEFARWLLTGQMPMHDYYTNGNLFLPWPANAPSYYNWTSETQGGGFIDGDGSVIVSG